MSNIHVEERLEGIRRVLLGVHGTSTRLSSSTKGTEREHFIAEFLGALLSPKYRFGCGDITDKNGNKSGQVDVVVENPFCPSLPVPGLSSPRLYLIEGVAAAIEVKSDLSAQWSMACQTAEKVKALRRGAGGGGSSVSGAIFGTGKLTNQVPVFAVGYEGWKTEATTREKLDSSSFDGILVIDPGIFVCNDLNESQLGPWSLWGLVCAMHRTANPIIAADPKPLEYAL